MVLTVYSEVLTLTNINSHSESLMHDFNFFGGGWMMFIWWFLLIALVIVVIRALLNTNKKSSDETPLEILKRRYANGEIDKEEFEKRKKDLL